MATTVVKFLKNNKLLFKYILSYFLIMLLPLIIGIVHYANTMSVLKAELRETSLSTLERDKNHIDQHFTAIDNFIFQLSYNPKIQDFQNIEDVFEKGNVYKSYEILKEIYPYTVVNNFVDKYFIFFRKNHSIIFPSSFYDYESFYNIFFQYDDMSSSEFLGELNKNFYKKILPAKTVTVENRQDRMVLYLRSFAPTLIFNTEVESTDSGFVVGVLIKESEIHKVFENLNMQLGDLLYIAGENGEFLTSNPKNLGEVKGIKVTPDSEKGYYIQKINGAEMNISYTKSANNGWTYVAAISDKAIVLKAEYIKKITLWFLFIISMTGIILIIFLSYQKSKPMKDLIAAVVSTQVFDFSGKYNEYVMIKNAIHQLLSSNKDLKKAMDNQMPYLQAAFLERLLSGDIIHLENLTNAMSQINMKINGDAFSVAIAQIVDYHYLETTDSLKELHVIKVLIKDYLNKCCAGCIHFYDMDEERLVLILAQTDEMPGTKLPEVIFTSANKHFSNTFHVSVRFFIGSAYSSLLDMWRSYNEAKETSESIFDHNNDYVLKYTINLQKNTYYYPIDIEVRMINNTKSGNKDEVHKLLEEIQTENFVKRMISVSLTEKLLLEICNTILKAIEALNIPNDHKLKSIQSFAENPELRMKPYEFFEKIRAAFDNLIDYVSKRKSEYKSRQIIDIIEFISREYSNLDMGLSYVATHFKMSETYFSQLFKAQTGENFFHYLENIRLEHACQLLLETNMSIKEIAEKTGYRNDQVFRRAFKRVKGINPLNYQK